MSHPASRRRFLAAASLTVTGGALAGALPRATGAAGTPDAPGDWGWVRDQFDASRDLAHFASFFIASHPRPVREAIDSLRRAIDANPYEVVEHGLFTKPLEVRTAAAKYLGGAPEEVALTRCTTEGLALVYAGLRLKPGQEILTTEHDHPSTHRALRFRAQRTGAQVKTVQLYKNSAQTTQDQIVWAEFL